MTKQTGSAKADRQGTKVDKTKSMPAPGSRPRRGRPRRDQAGEIDRELLRQALDHFLDKGYDGTTLSAITLSLGMSKQTVYSRYRDKHALFMAALQSAVDDWFAPIARLRDHESEDFETTLIDVATTIVSILLNPAGVKLIRITNAESYRRPEMGRETYGRAHNMIVQYLRDLFERRLRLDTDQAADVDDLATAFLNLMSGPARLNAWGLDAEPINIDDFVGRRVRLFLRGIEGQLVK